MAIECIMNHKSQKINVLTSPKSSLQLVVVTLQLKGHSYEDNCTFVGPSLAQFIETKIVSKQVNTHQ